MAGSASGLGGQPVVGGWWLGVLHGDTYMTPLGRSDL